MLRNMKIGMRLGLAFGVIVFLMLVMGVISQRGLKSVDDDVEALIKDSWPKTVQANNIIDEVNVIARALRNTLLTDDPSVVQKELARVTAANAAINNDYDQLEKNVIMLEEVWRTEEDLNLHIRSEEYRNLLLVLEMALKQPEIRFDTISSSTGIETIEKARNYNDRGERP